VDTIRAPPRETIAAFKPKRQTAYAGGLHRDCVKARLITTYRGPGTEWVTAENAAKALSMQQDFDGALFHVPTRSVAIFKGCFGGREAGVHHRSPRISGSGMTRLFLCVNAAGPAVGAGA
jgi:hypothetical protein